MNFDDNFAVNGRLTIAKCVEGCVEVGRRSRAGGIRDSGKRWVWVWVWVWEREAFGDG